MHLQSGDVLTSKLKPELLHVSAKMSMIKLSLLLILAVCHRFPSCSNTWQPGEFNTALGIMPNKAPTTEASSRCAALSYSIIVKIYGNMKCLDSCTSVTVQ